MERETEGPSTVLRLTGVFDRNSASELCNELARSAGQDVIVDFSQVREFADLGVAALALDLAGTRGRKLSLRGLRNHQLRLFRYLGVDVH